MTSQYSGKWVFGAALALFAATPGAAVTVPGDYATIQAALDAVSAGPLPGGTVVEVQPGTYMEALRYANTAKSLTVRSTAGAAATVVNAAGTGLPALTIRDASGTVRVDGFTLTGADSAEGGGVYFRTASPTLADCVVQGNRTSGGGGGLLLWASNAVIERCTIENNTAGQNGGGLQIVDGSRPQILNSHIRNNVSGAASAPGFGGGIDAADSSLTIRSTVISGNRAKFAGGGILLIGIFGSGNGTATLTLEDSEIADNTVERFDASSPPAEGGGIHIEDNALARITRSRIRNNTANTGGGISTLRGRYEVTDSVVEGNHAQDPQAIGGFGGGVNVISQAPQGGVVVLTDSVVRNNDALRAGGLLVTGNLCNAGGVCGTLTMTRALIDNNVATTAGGGINVGDTILTVTDSQVFRNRVNDVGSGFGGGFLITSSTATITNTTIAQNVAGRFGGGLFIDTGARVTVRGSNIYENSTTGPDGGGGVYVGSIGPPAGSIENSQIADNSDFQIREASGPPPGAPAPILSYLSNSITNQGPSKVYMSPVFPPGQITDIAAFNNLSPGVRTVGNTGSAPSFTSFAATPPQATSTLAWTSPRETTVNIANVAAPQAGPTGSLDVAPECTTVYTLGGVNATVIGTGTASPPPVCNGSEVSIFDESLSGMQVRQAERQVVAERVTVVSGSDITFKAGGQIVLKGPFTVEASARFIAAVDPCLCQ